VGDARDRVASDIPDLQSDIDAFVTRQAWTRSAVASPAKTPTRKGKLGQLVG